MALIPKLPVGRGVLGCVLLCAIALAAADAHEAFAEYVWHRVSVEVSARRVEVTVKVTFFEDWSGRERRTMDANGDGRIQRSETERHAARLAESLEGDVALRVAGRRMPLIPLYDPEIDLLGNDTTGPAHHQLTLRYFISLPEALAAGTPLVVENRLWAAAPSFGEIEAKTAGGVIFATEQVSDERTSEARRAGEPLRFGVRILQTR